MFRLHMIVIMIDINMTSYFLSNQRHFNPLIILARPLSIDWSFSKLKLKQKARFQLNKLHNAGVDNLRPVGQKSALREHFIRSAVQNATIEQLQLIQKKQKSQKRKPHAFIQHRMI